MLDDDEIEHWILVRRIVAYMLAAHDRGDIRTRDLAVSWLDTLCSQMLRMNGRKWECAANPLRNAVTETKPHAVH